MQPGNPTYSRRIEFDVSVTLSNCAADRPAVMDLGGGVGLFSLTIALLGFRSVIADDFESWDDKDRRQMMHAFDTAGVEVIQRDLLAEPLDLACESLDAVTSFHFLEHLHQSPRQLFRQAVDALRPGGTFVVAGPNCVNARKRLTVPFGRGAWSPMEAWYDEPEFRGHVREPSVGDLAYITRDLGLIDVKTYGRNFLGESHDGILGRAAKAVDPILSRFPGLCSDIYAAARKREMA
jgi:SAM-dependent methyltransferase